jgi:hypothetical protein
LENVPVDEVAGDLPRVKSVKAGRASWVLDIVWRDGSRDCVDLTGLVHRSRHFRQFLGEPATFKRVKVVDWGAGVGWANGLDFSADTLKTMADEQRPLGGNDLRAFEAANKFNTAETAGLLDVSERTVREYRVARRLPQTVTLALRALMSSSAVLNAHFRPLARRPRGRPKKLSSA